MDLFHLHIHNGNVLEKIVSCIPTPLEYLWWMILVSSKLINCNYLVNHASGPSNCTISSNTFTLCSHCSMISFMGVSSYTCFKSWYLESRWSDSSAISYYSIKHLYIPEAFSGIPSLKTVVHFLDHSFTIGDPRIFVNGFNL